MREAPYYQVPLVRRDRSVRDWAVVDYEDALRVAVYRWHRNSNGYAARPAGQGRIVLMHRQLLGLSPGDGVEVDHVNRDKLDNRRENLRAGTHAENARERAVA